MAKTIPQLTDATTVNAADELIIQQGGITKRATGAELAKGLNTINGTASVKDFGAVGDGVADDTAAIQAAVTASADKPLHFSAGTYMVTSPLTGTGAVYPSGSAGAAFVNYSVDLNDSDVLMSFNFRSNQSTLFGKPVDVERVFTTSRGSSGYVPTRSGVWRKVEANRARVSDLGLLVETASSNNVRFSRDLSITHRAATGTPVGTFIDGEVVTASGDSLAGTGTYVTIPGATSSSAHYLRNGTGTFGPSDASPPLATLTGGTSGATASVSSSTAPTIHWQHTNVSITRTRGIDGLDGAASRVEATATNAVVKQAITQASQQRVLSAFMRRVAGGGTIEITQNDGATWTAVSPTTEWTRVSIPAATVTDPVVGFRIVNKGDVVEIDFVQNENNSFVTSPIETLQASVTRNIDNVSMSWSAYPRLLTMRRFTTDVSFVPSQVVSAGTMFDITDGTNSNVLRNNYRISDFQAGLTVITAGSTIIGLDPQDEAGYFVAPDVPSRFVASFDMTNNWMSVSMDGSGRTDANVALPRTESSWAAANTLNKLTMGAQQAALVPINGFIRHFTIYNYAMSPELAAQTSKL